MRRRDLLLSAGGMASIWATAHARGPARAAGPAITAPEIDFIGSLPDLLAISGVSGITITLLAGKRTSWHGDFGVADRAGDAINPATIWKAASLSKQASGYAALRLIDAGGLDLNRPLALYLGDDAPPDPAARRITARHVLTHSSGLPNWRTTRELVPSFAPGSGFRYSGEGYFLLARAIERVTGIGFEAYMQQAVFGPLGMASSTYLWRPDLAARLAPGHRWEGAAWDDAGWRDRLQARITESGLPAAQWTLDRVAQEMAPISGPDQGVPPLPGQIYYPNPAMSLMTTAADYLTLMLRFMTHVGDGLDLSPRLRAMTARPLVWINQAISWGLRCRIETAGDVRYLFQHGSLAGACTSFVLLHPASATGVAVFTNHSNGHRVIDRVFRAVTGREHPVFLWAS